MEKWISVKDKLPDKSGKYLVTYGSNLNKDERLIEIAGFSKNLTSLDKYDFPKREFNRPGFYGYDSEYGYYEQTKVIAWMELPEVYKGE